MRQAEEELIHRQHAFIKIENEFLSYFFNRSHRKEELARLCMVVEPGFFYSAFNGDCWSTMARLAVERDTVEWCNPLIVAEYLTDNPVAPTRVYALSDAVTRILNTAEADAAITLPEAHRLATLIRDEHQQRTVRGSMTRVMNATSREDFHNSLADLRARIEDCQRADTGDIKTVWQGLETWKAECEAAKSGAAINTGWPTIDRAFGLIRGGEVVICAARAGVGKTWGGSSMAVHNAERGRKTLFCTMEMTTSEMAERIVAQSMVMAPRDMRLSHDNLKVPDAREHLPHLDNIRIYDLPLSIGGLSTVVKQAQASGFDPDLIVIDYMGLIVWEGNKNSIQYERASEIARQLKTQAKRIGKAVFCLAQLSREAGDGYDEPRLDMIRDSGAIEEAADRVLLMWKNAGSVMVKVAKNRHGPEGAQAMLRYNDGLRLDEIQVRSHG